MVLGILLTVVLISGSHGEISFTSFYEDHMVLQRGPQNAVVAGRATKIGDTVTVTVGNDVASATGKVTKADDGRGFWKVKLPPVTAKGPFTVTVKSSEGSVSIHDVLFGDVWVCSGQSNMEFNMYQVMNSSDEIAASMNYPDIRFFKVDHNVSSTPLDDVLRVKISWTKSNWKDIYGLSALCYMFGQRLQAHTKAPVGLVESDWWGTAISSWVTPEAISKCSSQGKREEQPGPSNLWNAMIHPLLTMSIYGALWYQGESDAWHPDNYACTFPVMIADWRKHWHHQSLGATPDDFPFGFIQLAAYRNDTSLRGGWPDTRWAQTADYGYVPNPKMKNTFMAVAMDLPDFGSSWGQIHPRIKQDIADRLILPTMSVAYSIPNLDYQGPFPSSYTLDNTAHTLTIEFNHGKTPIEIRNNDGYEVCCSTHKTCDSSSTWAASPITAHTTATVTLSTSACGAKTPAGVRYAWWESPCPLRGCAVYGRDNDLPAPPFKKLDGF